MATEKGGCVLISGGATEGGAAVRDFCNLTGQSLEGLDFGCLETLDASSSRYKCCLLLSDRQPARQALASAARELSPGAALYVSSSKVADPEQLSKDLLFSGFTQSSEPPPPGMVLAHRPAWEVGAKATLSLQRPAQQAGTSGSPAPTAAKNAWKLSMEDTGDDEMVDDEQLLTEEDRQRPAAAPAAEGDCSTSKSACKNCSCGRAEKEAAGEKVVLTQEMLDNPQTNCGSCSLGDAFRCAGCPYRGLPAFEAGKKITLPPSFLTADA